MYMDDISIVRLGQYDNATQGDKTRALVMAGFGTAGPPMAADAMLLLYTFAIAILIGIGPLFILFLLFDKTKDMFQRWLFYLIATLFSMAVLSVVVSMCLDMSLRVAGALWGAKIVNTILGNGPEGLSSQALQYGGVGLLLTVLMISVPPMMGWIFQGTVGNYLTYSVFGTGGARPGPQGQPAGAALSPPSINNPNTGQRNGGHGEFTRPNNRSWMGTSEVDQSNHIKKKNG